MQYLPVPNPPFALPGSAFVILTGQTGNGKSWQMMRALTARLDDEPLVAPCLYVLCETSGEGTSGELLADPEMCLVWPVADCDEAQDALRTCFPADGPLTLGAARKALHDRLTAKAKAAGLPLPAAPVPTRLDRWPLRAVAVDSASTLHAGQINRVRRSEIEKLERATRSGGGGGRSSSRREVYNDQKTLSQLATPDSLDLVDRLNGIAQRVRGLLVLVACHTRGAMRVIRDDKGAVTGEVQVGEAPNFGAPKVKDADVVATAYAPLWNALAAKANVIWHLFATAPDFTGEPVAAINAKPSAVRFGAITMRGRYPGLGEVMWPKRQGGEGWLALFDALPPYWHPDAPLTDESPFSAPRGLASPDLGVVLEACVAYHRERESQPTRS